MESLYPLPNGDRLHVADAATVVAALPGILQTFRDGATEPVFFGDGRPDGVVISFGQWTQYEAYRTDAEEEERRLEIVRRHLAETGERLSPEEAARLSDAMPRPTSERLQTVPTTTAAETITRPALLTGPLFFGDHSTPEAVLLPFDQWIDFDVQMDEFEFEERTLQLARERIANSRIEDSVSFEDMMAEFGLDPDTGEPVDPDSGKA
ncbi:hypothetical protein ACFVWG_37340 [Kribbella sp. NPDC058245]|uniref:hypothetical protein n=1 Tax=Kribbella sp. NPDC058245 TaxID=3346399 RepID=UPI0036F08F69